MGVEFSIARLKDEMQTVTNKQAVQKIRLEMAKMEDWARGKLDWGNRQGHLDVKYLADRYAKGVEKVNAFCAKKHLMLSPADGFGGCQTNILGFANASVKDPQNQPTLGL